MKGYLSAGLILLLFSGLTFQSKAQTIELLGGNTLNGAVTGSVLGAATMALNNSDDFAPLRVGLGLGTIGGAAIGLYDVATLPRGQQFFISGAFNDGNNTSVIILLDTFYGAAGGAIMASAGMLVANRPVLDGLQYGSGVGAWVGFGFGLIDAFIIAERNRDLIGSNLLTSETLLTYRAGNYSIGLIRPVLHEQVQFNSVEPRINIEPALGVLSLKMNF